MAVEFEIIDNNELQFDLGGSQEICFDTRDIVEVVQSGDYEDLTNKPQINGVELVGNKTTEDLGIDVGVTSWNGETGAVTFSESDPTVPSWAKQTNPPSYELTYDESVSVGSAEVGEAVTGEPNYTPSGAISIPTLNWEFKNKKLYLYGVTAPTFTGNGVKFAVEQEN